MFQKLKRFQSCLGNNHRETIDNATLVNFFDSDFSSLTAYWGSVIASSGEKLSQISGVELLFENLKNLTHTKINEII